MKRERRPNEYMDLEDEHRQSELAAAKFKPLPLREYREQSSRGEEIMGEFAGGLLEFLFEIILEMLFGG